MKYKASELISRAKDLADIQNTDFLSHEELTRYINDAWITVYQWLINKGDKQFVKEVLLETAGSFNDWTEFLIPNDLYQIKSLKNKNSGSEILRAAETDSLNSGHYDIVNNRIRLYGNTNGPILLTYWITPTFLSFPNKDIEWDNNYQILDYCNNSILLSNGDIYNVVTQSLVGSISINEEYNYQLGNGYYIEERDGLYFVFNFNNEELNIITPEEDTSLTFFKDRNGSIFYQVLRDSKYSGPLSVLNNGQMLVVDEYEDSGYPKYVTSDIEREYWIYYNESNKELVIYKEDDDDELEIDTSLFSTFTSINWADNFDNKPAFYLTSNKNELYFFTFDESIEYDKLNIRPALIKAFLRYGPLISDGTFMTVKSVIPDTDMNFPNELYFSLLSADLGLRFAMKMNANTDGLNNLYLNMQTTFMNTLSQSADYPRIKRAYSR